jgi:flagellar hook-associated protein 3 FlgL
MTRISENQMIRSMVSQMLANQQTVNKYSQEVTTGLKVQNPGDSRLSGTISQFREMESRISGHQDRIKTVQGLLTFQDGVVSQVNDALVRAQELATQGANETLDPAHRALISDEVMALRDHIVSLANSTYQGRYIFGGNDDGTPPYTAQTYTNPPTGPESQRYTYNTSLAAGQTRTVNVTDDTSITVNTPGSTVFDNSIQALERLGRSLSGYATNPASGTPDGTGSAYTFPAQYTTQTQDIKATIDLLNNARETDVLPEQSSIAGRLARLSSANDVLTQNMNSAKDVLGRLQDADITQSASDLTLAQSALQASLTVTTRLMQQKGVMDYI